MSTNKPVRCFGEHTRPLFAHDVATMRTTVRHLSLRLRDHDDAEAWHALGAALVSLGDRAAALVAFRNALRVDERSFSSQLALGNLLFDSGQCERAFSCFGIAVDA